MKHATILSGVLALLVAASGCAHRSDAVKSADNLNSGGKAAIDPYISLRDAYIQFRRKQIHE